MLHANRFNPYTHYTMKTSLSSQGLASLLLIAFLLGANKADAQVIQIDSGAASNPLYAVGPIYMSTTLFYRYSRYAYLYTQSELEAVGFTPGTTITTVGWMKNTSSTAAGPDSKPAVTARIFIASVIITPS